MQYTILGLQIIELGILFYENKKWTKFIIKLTHKPMTVKT